MKCRYINRHLQIHSLDNIVNQSRQECSFKIPSNPSLCNDNKSQERTLCIMSRIKRKNPRKECQHSVESMKHKCENALTIDFCLKEKSSTFFHSEVIWPYSMLNLKKKRCMLPFCTSKSITRLCLQFIWTLSFIPNILLL